MSVPLTHTHPQRQWQAVERGREGRGGRGVWAVTDVVDIDIELALVVVAVLPLGDCVCANYWWRLQLRLSRD